jgi:hypothetical protein
VCVSRPESWRQYPDRHGAGTEEFSGWSGATRRASKAFSVSAHPSHRLLAYLSGWGREVCPGPVTHGVWAREPVSQTCRAAPWDFSERDAVMGSLASRSGGRGWIRYDTRNDVGRRCLVLLGFKCIVSMWVGEGRMRDRPGCRNKARTGKTGVGLIQIGSICVRLISSTYKPPPVMNATGEGSMSGMSLRSLARG